MKNLFIAALLFIMSIGTIFAQSSNSFPISLGDYKMYCIPFSTVYTSDMASCVSTRNNKQVASALLTYDKNKNFTAHFIKYDSAGSIESEEEWIVLKDGSKTQKLLKNGNVYKEIGYYSPEATENQKIQISYETNYNENGEKDGKSLIYNNTGNILEEMTFKNGVLNGMYNNYYADGSINESGCYVNGKKDGEWLTIEVFPTEDIKTIYKHGKAIHQTRYIPGSGLEIKDF